MITRSLSKTVAFSKPFQLKGIDRVLPAGDYRVVTDEELTRACPYPVYRRVATMMFVPDPIQSFPARTHVAVSFVITTRQLRISAARLS
jgi:hypothetical protein